MLTNKINREVQSIDNHVAAISDKAEELTTLIRAAKNEKDDNAFRALWKKREDLFEKAKTLSYQKMQWLRAAFRNNAENN